METLPEFWPTLRAELLAFANYEICQTSMHRFESGHRLSKPTQACRFFMLTVTLSMQKAVIITGSDAKLVVDGKAGSLADVTEDNFDWAQDKTKTKANLHILFTSSEHFSSILIDNRQLRGVRVIIGPFS